MWMGTKLSLLQESGQGRLGWQTPKPNTTENSTPAKMERPQTRCPQTLNSEKPQSSQKPNQETQIDKYPSQTKIHQQWEAEMERLNTKHNLDYFSDSQLHSESDEGEEYKYEHGYETLI